MSRKAKLLLNGKTLSGGDAAAIDDESAIKSSPAKPSQVSFVRFELKLTGGVMDHQTKTKKTKINEHIPSNPKP